MFPYEFNHCAKPCKVTVHNVSKTRWRAVGTWGDRHVEGRNEGSSGAAIEAWKAQVSVEHDKGIG